MPKLMRQSLAYDEIRLHFPPQGRRPKFRQELVRQVDCDRTHRFEYIAFGRRVKALFWRPRPPLIYQSIPYESVAFNRSSEVTAIA